MQHVLRGRIQQNRCAARAGNLKDAHDTGSVTRLQDFYRHRLLYHLTAVGEAAHRAVLEVEATVGKTGSLQASMLGKIRDALVALVELSRSESPLPDSVLRDLHDLHSGFDPLTVEANRFIGELDRTTGQDRLAEERFTLYKEALLAYVGALLTFSGAKASGSHLPPIHSVKSA